MSKKIKKACLALTLAALVGVSVGTSACDSETDHPNVQITIEFNDETYVIDYTLYRKMYPQTVQHFIELADEGFYDDTVIHDYKSSDWVGGAYGYNRVKDEAPFVYEDSFTSNMGEYLEYNCLEEDYYSLVNNGSFSSSVFKTMIYNADNTPALSDPLPTVIGEFSENHHNIKGDKGLKASFGTLKMFYYTKDVSEHVYVKNSVGQIMPHDYKYNCATSLFSMQVDDSTLYSANRYAVFGQLADDDARSELEDLLEDISDYATGLGSTSKWSSTISMLTDRLDPIEEGRDVSTTFTVTSMPIIIRSVKVTQH